MELVMATLQSLYPRHKTVMVFVVFVPMKALMRHCFTLVNAAEQ